MNLDVKKINDGTKISQSKDGAQTRDEGMNLSCRASCARYVINIDENDEYTYSCVVKKKKKNVISTGALETQVTRELLSLLNQALGACLRP